MSVRTSARSNKGQNKYIESLLQEESETPKKKQTKKRTDPATTENKQTEALQSSTKDNEKDEADEGYVRCVCGASDENYDAPEYSHGDMVQCDGCDSWQHIKCMTDGKETIDGLMNEDSKYYCELCDPSLYAHLEKSKEAEVSEEDDYDDDIYKPVIDHNDNDTDFFLDEESPRKRKRSTSSNSIKLPAQTKEVKKNNGPRKKKKSAGTIAANTDQDKIPVKRDFESEKEHKLRLNARNMFSVLFSKFIIPETVEAKLYDLPHGKDITLVSTDFAHDLEDELYNACLNVEFGTLDKTYTEKVRSLYSNLKDKKNLKLKAHVIEGKLPLNKLVNMNASELANPDLQEFKEKREKATLENFIVEIPDKPIYVKTHKGDELIENSTEPQEDVLYSMDSIRLHNGDDNRINDNKDEMDQTSVIPKEHAQEHSGVDPTQNGTAQGESLKCAFLYPGLGFEFTGYLSYIGTSEKLKRDISKEAIGDGNLFVEGRLPTTTAAPYLKEVSSSRAIIVYQLFASDDDESKKTFAEVVDSLETKGRIAGIKPKTRYEKDFYIIPSRNGEVPEILDNILGNPNNERSLSVKADERTLFAFVVIKQELIH
ncbi:hypothetical protein SUVZ_11G2090 [Saccharomyces uvarum]|uniref:Transcription factor BYE1 n=1 Tax=Saccharomyces uvarum TaxID=230603 RepID=A0ABN8WJ88_SACUV|nr:hypothetical protein SUVZ_11G2090 [Saccharomyces uvarum]